MAKRVEIMKNAMEEGRKIILGLSPWASLLVMTSTTMEKKVMGKEVMDQVVAMLVVLSLDWLVHLYLAITFPLAPSLGIDGVSGSHPSPYPLALPLPAPIIYHSTPCIGNIVDGKEDGDHGECDGGEMAEGRKLSLMRKQ